MLTQGYLFKRDILIGDNDRRDVSNYVNFNSTSDVESYTEEMFHQRRS